ncbi:hypothetical protein [Sphingobacterium deserti]|uniref:hypothetical protein n=1 Tax=Sphingobacterium deserti TaxID=1229276 RepID=UPI00103B018C|nr:hypothetical protein [Sphingobacterium deserti]
MGFSPVHSQFTEVDVLEQLPPLGQPQSIVFGVVPSGTIQLTAATHEKASLPPLPVDPPKICFSCSLDNL